MWLRWFVVGAAVIEAGWILFDGAHALLLGDFVTPASGPYAGQLGPWAALVAAAGLDPRGTPIKLLFVVYGALWLAIVAAWLRRVRWSDRAMLVAAAGALWYLPIGTALSALQIVLLVFLRRRARPSVDAAAEERDRRSQA